MPLENLQSRENASLREMTGDAGDGASIKSDPIDELNFADQSSSITDENWVRELS